MSEHEKPNQEREPVVGESAMTEMEAAARIFALQDHIHAAQRTQGIRTIKAPPALQRFVREAQERAPQPSSRENYNPAQGSPNTP